MFWHGNGGRRLCRYHRHHHGNKSLLSNDFSSASLNLYFLADYVPDHQGRPHYQSTYGTIIRFFVPLAVLLVFRTVFAFTHNPGSLLRPLRIKSSPTFPTSERFKLSGIIPSSQAWGTGLGSYEIREKIVPRAIILATCLRGPFTYALVPPLSPSLALVRAVFLLMFALVSVGRRVVRPDRPFCSPKFRRGPSGLPQYAALRAQGPPAH